MKLVASMLVLACLSGCAMYQSKIQVAGNTLVLPKDATFSWLAVSIPTTNGAISLTISNGVFKMNPAVIDAATAHDVALMNAAGNLAGQAAAQAVKAMAKP